ncbi:MAG: SDR family NAD(P)-dependent oxidoreductase [Alphaproteobacteria bacterium]|tara:strand:- start:146 stop:892 length:747 start_codon:yes stop_codon:yes gene_type:complete
MKLIFKGKVAVVTGGSGGIGLDVSKKLAKLKIKVLILDINKPNISKNKFIYFEKVDLSNENEINQAINKFIKKEKRIDYIVNAAGVLWFDKDIGLEKIKNDIWDKVFTINLKSMLIVIKKILPNMKKNKFGSIVNISSIDALSGDDKPQEAYGASKAAMIRLSKSIAIQYANKNIRSNSILPGPVETPMQKRWKKNPNAKKNLTKIIPLQRVGKPENIADTVLFLLSEQSCFITGTEIIVDGGLKARP